MSCPGGPLSNFADGFSLSLWYRETTPLGNVYIVASTGSAPAANESHHAAISWDFDTERLRFWFDGTLATDTSAKPFTSGYLDGVRIYTRAVSPIEAIELLNE